MNMRKPGPLNVVPARACCPVCGKPSYSLNGLHPQCAVAQADAAHRATLKENLANSDIPLPEKPPTKDWRSRTW